MTCRPTNPGPYEIQPAYKHDEIARQFWRLSFRVGREYMTGRDGGGLPMLIEHEREEKASYGRRLRTTKPRNFVGPIIRRYNDLVFRKAPVRDAEADSFWTDFWTNCDGRGTPINSFMKDSLAVAQIDRECYLVPDVYKPPASGPVTVAAIAQAGSIPSICRVSASAVVAWEDSSNGALMECLMQWKRRDGETVLRWWGEKERQDFVLDAKQLQTGAMVITAIDPPFVHGYDCLPVVRLRPNLDPLGQIGFSNGDSQAGPLAESQQSIMNLLSLLNEEILNVTFSQMIASGVSEAQVNDVKVGNNRILCLPNPASKVDMIGADPAQAASIREAILDETNNLMRAAGVNQGAAEQVQSGIALAFRHNDLATIVAALANAAEVGENAATAVIASAWGKDAPTPTNYQGKDADLPAFDAESNTMVAIVSNAALPQTIRRKVAERFASRNLSLDDAENKQLQSELEDTAAMAAATKSTNPFPPRRDPTQTAA